MPTLAPAADHSTVVDMQRYEDHVNPQWVKLLKLLRMDVDYVRCEGVELFTSDGRVILDFLSGYCVHNIGHNHPRVIDALTHELNNPGPAMVQSDVVRLAGDLGARLCKLAGGGLRKVFFPSSGSEGVEAAIKFSRAHTGRDGLLCCQGAFHGLTCGALSLMDNPFWSGGFGPLLAHTKGIPFGNVEALKESLSTRKFAAFIVEPIQSEAGIRVPSAEYLQQAQALCRKYGTVFVLDEVQTGMYRCGTFLAAHQLGVEPDIVILAKALSGGLIPVGAVLMKDEIYDSVFTSLKRAFVHTSTFSENRISMRAGMATLDVLEQEQLGPRCVRMGELLRQRLRDRLTKFEMVQEILGSGLLCGIQFKAPKKLSLKIAYETFHHIHAGMFGQMVVMRLFNDENILAQICGNNFMVLKVAPPLVVTEEQINQFVDSMERVLAAIHSSGSFWTDAVSLVKRVTNL